MHSCFFAERITTDDIYSCKNKGKDDFCADGISWKGLHDGP